MTAAGFVRRNWLAAGILLLAAATAAGCRPRAPQGEIGRATPPPGEAVERQPSSGYAPSAASAADPELQRLLEREIARIPGRVAIHVRVEDGRQAGIRAEEPMPAASLIKVPVMVVAEEGWRAGWLPRARGDDRRLRAMIVRSDNPAAAALIGRIGLRRINYWLRRHGYFRTRLRHRMAAAGSRRLNVTTAAEMTRMMLALARGELGDARAAREMRALLLAQQRRDRIPAGLPPGVTVGNKTGTLAGVVNDAAFVETKADGRPLRYAIAVLTEEAGPEAMAIAAIAGLSRAVHAHLTGGRYGGTSATASPEGSDTPTPLKARTR